MESTATAGLQELRLNERPAASDQNIPLTRTPADVDQAPATDNQRYGASSFTKDAKDVPSKAILPSTRPTIAPRENSFRFLVTTKPAQLKDKVTMQENRKHVMRNFLRKERRKAGGTRDMRAEGPVEEEKRRRLDHAHRQVAKTPKNLAAAVRGLDTVEVTPDRLDLETKGWMKESTGEWPEESEEADRSMIAWNLWNREARSDRPGGSANSPERPLNKAAGLVSRNDKADLFVKPTSTDTVEDLKPIITPEFPSSGPSIGIQDLEGRVHHQNEKSYHFAQPEVSERCADQPVDDTALASDSIHGQSLTRVKSPLVLPLLDFETLNAAPKLASQDRVRNNPFQRRMQQLLEDLALEEESSSDRSSSTADGDDASGHNDHLASYSGYRSHNGAPNSDSPDSSSDSRSSGQHASGSTSQTPRDQFSGSSRTAHGPRLTQGFGDKECVGISTRQTRNDQENGKVIPCPLRLELKCAGTDDNMSSLLRELSNSTHNIFYCNRCKSLLSRITHTHDAERLRWLRKEAKERWQVHLKSCHDDHCVMPACVAQTNGEVRHKHNENCKTNREDEKEADANYLYRTLGVAELGVEIGSKTDHKGKRNSTARKIVKVAEDATQRNMELENELRYRKQKLEMLKQVNREHCHEIYKLRSSNEELCSIIKHALEDMKRGKVDLTDALRDRIEHHAPSALGGFYFANTRSYVSPIPFADNSLCNTPVILSYQGSNALHTVSNIANGVNRRDGAPTDISSLLGPAAKRRREEMATHDEPWNFPHSPRIENSGPIQDDYYTDFTGAATGALASIETSGQAAFAAGSSPDQFPRLDSMPLQRYHQQASAEAYNDTNQSIGRPVSRGNTRPDSPVLEFESSSRHNVAITQFPQPMSGEQLLSTTPGPLSWMHPDQGIVDPSILGAISEPQLRAYYFGRYM